jgi:hypothetical protein
VPIHHSSPVPCHNLQSHDGMRLLYLCLASLLVSGRAIAGDSHTPPDPHSLSATVGRGLADLPHWMGGLPADAPPRRGTPEYDAWMAARAKEAARPKSGDSKPTVSH